MRMGTADPFVGGVGGENHGTDNAGRLRCPAPRATIRTACSPVRSWSTPPAGRLSTRRSPTTQPMSTPSTPATSPATPPSPHRSSEPAQATATPWAISSVTVWTERGRSGRVFRVGSGHRDGCPVRVRQHRRRVRGTRCGASALRDRARGRPQGPGKRGHARGASGGWSFASTRLSGAHGPRSRVRHAASNPGTSTVSRPRAARSRPRSLPYRNP